MLAESKKVYVLDTSVLIHDPEAVFEFDDNYLLIPIAVLEELDGLKKAQGDLGFRAREALRNLNQLFDNLGSEDLKQGIKIKNGGMLRFDLNSNSYELLPSVMDRSRDNSIILAAIRIKKENPENKVVVVSKDVNMRIKALFLGVEAEDYEADKVRDIDVLYTGVSNLSISENSLAQFYQDGRLRDFSGIFEGDLKSNQCFRLSSDNNDKIALARYIKSEDSLIWVNPPIFFDSFSGEIKPINDEQILAYDMLTDSDIRLVSLFGPPGTGKTLIALLAGINQLQSSYEKMVIFRATKELGDSLGFLPGDKEEKMAPWAKPIVNTLRFLYGGKTHKMGSCDSDKRGSFYPSDELIFKGLLEIDSFNFIRGDTFYDSYVVVDDAQNLTPHIMKALLTRCGPGSKIVLTGDLRQIDDSHLDAHSSGLTRVLSRFPGNYEAYGQLNLVKGERSDLANAADQLL